VAGVYPLRQVTRPINAYKDKVRPALEVTLASLQNTGVRLLLKANTRYCGSLSQKLAFREKNILDQALKRPFLTKN